MVKDTPGILKSQLYLSLGWVGSDATKRGRSKVVDLGGSASWSPLARPEGGPWSCTVQMACGTCVDLRWVTQRQRVLGW